MLIPQVIEGKYRYIYHQLNWRRYILVSSWDQIKEIDHNSDNVLSLQAAAREILQPKHTVVGFEWHDKKGFDGAPLLRTIRYFVTAHLPNIFPYIRASIRFRFDSQVETHPIIKGMSCVFTRLDCYSR